MVPPTPLLESTGPVINVQLVAGGAGLAAVSESTAAAALRAGLVVPVKMQPAIPQGAVALIWRDGAERWRVHLLRRALAAAAGVG